MTEEIVEETRERMESALIALKREFTSVRTGKAAPSLLDQVRVEAYGSLMPLSQLGTVTAPDATLLVVQPFDKSVIDEIAKAIQMSDLGLNPANDGVVIRVPIPPLTEERRREYARVLHRMAEDGRISLRQARKAGRDFVGALLKEHEIGEDEGRRAQQTLDDLTREYAGKVDEMLKLKEAEVMAI
ncbi:MAG: ribosome recycling factor [Gemmatimonadetes bacterium]|nr:ribosome recycling factor [Gemmatimonadota bacterium]